MEKIIIEIDGKLKKKFKAKLAGKGVTLKKYLTGVIKRYVGGKE